MAAAAITRRPAPATVPDLELEPLAPNYRGFVLRDAPVTREQLANVDMSYLNELAAQQRREGGAA